MSMTSTITSINTSTHKSNSTHRISNGAQACAACKYQRRKCAPDCILAPYFPHDKQPQFLNAHKLFGVSNITKIIRDLDQRDKDMAMATIIFQSDMRARDPVSGCYGIVRALHYQTEYVKNELEFVRHQITVCRAHQAAYQQQLQISDDKSIKNDPTTLSYEILNCKRMKMMLVAARFSTTILLHKTMVFRIFSILGVCRTLNGFHQRDLAIGKDHR